MCIRHEVSLFLTHTHLGLRVDIEKLDSREEELLAELNKIREIKRTTKLNLTFLEREANERGRIVPPVFEKEPEPTSQPLSGSTRSSSVKSDLTPWKHDVITTQT